MKILFAYPFAQVVIPALVALAVVAMTHILTGHRDLQNRRREQRIVYLVNAFRGLSKANHHPRLYEVAEELEQAIADLQLFGTPKQIQLARKFATDLGTTQEADMDDLLNELRNSLRQELGRPPVTGNLAWLKIGRGEKSEKAHVS